MIFFKHKTVVIVFPYSQCIGNEVLFSICLLLLIVIMTLVFISYIRVGTLHYLFHSGSNKNVVKQNIVHIIRIFGFVWIYFDLNLVLNQKVTMLHLKNQSFF